MKKIKIALIQSKMFVDPVKNTERMARKVEECAKKGAKIIFLPELFTTEYFPQSENKKNFKLAEKIPGPTTELFSDIARRNKAVVLLPMFEERTRGLYHNTAVVIDADGKILGKYRKMHIPDDPCFYEKYYFAPGDLGFKVFNTRYAKIGTLICWDQWYPEAARLTALQGAEILYYPTAIGWHDSEASKARKLQLSAWKTIQTSHSIANGVFVVSANRVGKEKKLKFWGNSFVVSPEGEILKQLSNTKEEKLFAELELKKIDQFRQEWPFLRDRRIDAYKKITSRFLNE